MQRNDKPLCDSDDGMDRTKNSVAAPRKYFTDLPLYHTLEITGPCKIQVVGTSLKKARVYVEAAREVEIKR